MKFLDECRWPRRWSAIEIRAQMATVEPVERERRAWRRRRRRSSAEREMAADAEKQTSKCAAQAAKKGEGQKKRETTRCE